MEFVKVAEISELQQEKMKVVLVDQREVLLVNVDGIYYALSNKCPHAGGSLVRGILNGDIITCPLHGVEIDVKTGQVISEEEIIFVKFKDRDDHKYIVKVIGSEIMIKVGNDK